LNCHRERFLRADVSSVGPSSFTLTKSWRSGRRLSKYFIVEILPTRLMKPNFRNKASLRIERLILVTSCILREQSCSHQNDSWVIKKSWMSIQQDATKFQLVAPSFNICCSTNVELCIIGIKPSSLSARVFAANQSGSSLSYSVAAVFVAA